METLTIEVSTKEQVKVFESLAKVCNAPLKKTKTNYNPAFVAKVKQSEKSFSKGNFKKIKTEDLWK